MAVVNCADFGEIGALEVAVAGIDAERFSGAFEDMGGDELQGDGLEAAILIEFIGIEWAGDIFDMNDGLGVINGASEDIVGEASHDGEADEEDHQAEVFASDGEIEQDIVETEDASFETWNHK